MTTPIHAELTREWFAREDELTSTLAALIDEGLGYQEAAALVWGDGPGLDATPEVRAVWVEHVVRREIDAMVQRLPWLRGVA